MSDDRERELRFKLLAAEIENKKADTAWKARQMRYEFAKVAAAYLVGIAAVAGIIIGVGRWINPERQPPGTYIQLPPGTVITTPTGTKP